MSTFFMRRSQRLTRWGGEASSDMGPAPPAAPSRPLAGFPCHDGVHEISPPRRFCGGEEAYDETAGGALREDLLANGVGAWRLAEHYARRPLHSWLEVGAGGGACTLGLVAAAPAQNKIITDTSAVFLGIIRRKLTALGISSEGCTYATLAGEDLDRLAPESLDAIVVASAVHHVSDWRSFLNATARALAPGGVMVMQEPFREGYLLMTMAMELVLAAEWARELPPDDIAKIMHCRDSTYFLSDGAIEKIGEDKHMFLIDEVAAASEAAGFARCAFHRNVHFDSFASGDLIPRNLGCSFSQYLLAFLGIHHRVSQPGVEILQQRLTPILLPLDRLSLQGDGPAMVACVAFVK